MNVREANVISEFIRQKGNWFFGLKELKMMTMCARHYIFWAETFINSDEIMRVHGLIYQSVIFEERALEKSGRIESGDE